MRISIAKPQIGDEEIAAVEKVLKSGMIASGPETSKFESEFAEFVGCKFACAVNNGTSAIALAISAIGVKPGQEIITSPLTFVATANAILSCGAIPVFADIEKDTFNLSPESVEDSITEKTAAIMPVHLYGSVTNISKIKKLINNKNIFIIDDCAQAHGASDDKGKKVGSIADISTFSLYPGKNLGAYGDAGVITTNSNVINKKIRKIRNLGSEKKFIHDTIGFNSRLDTIQAIILNHKLKNLKKLNQKRKKIAKKYDKFIFNKKIRKIRYSKNCIYHQYVILTKYRSKLIKMFKQKKIQYGFHYPYPIHKLKVFKNYFKAQKFKNSEILAKEGISLPIDPNLSNKEVSIIINTINKL